MNFWDVFDAAAARFADRTAVEVQRRDTVERHTYRQLRELALAHAGWLSSQGIGAGDRCAILADNDASWCAAYLGILRIAAVAVPLDTNYSAAQVETILRDVGARVLFANARLMPVAREAAANIPSILPADVVSVGVRGADRLRQGYGESAEASATAEAPRYVRSSENDGAVILYTSGTTADPKGVVLSHGNLIAARDAAFHRIAVSEHDSVLGVLPLFHALAQLATLLLPLAAGARVVFLETLSASELLCALVERDITVFACVPQFFDLIHERLMSELQRGGMVKRLLFHRLLATSFWLRRSGINVGRLLFRRVHRLIGPRMRFFVTGGSRFDPAIGRDFYALGFTVLQAYGLTETTGAATLTTPDEAYADTVGRPLPGEGIRILAPAGDDIDGEIAVRGPVVMQGYFNRPDATRDALQDGWLLTGDLGRLDARGRLIITGRKKEVIVLASGKNIYPEEVEARYRRSPFIKEICVVEHATFAETAAEGLFAVVVPDLALLRKRRIANIGDLLRFEMDGQSIHLPPHKRLVGYELSFDPLPRTTTGEIKRHEVERRLREKHRRRAHDAASESDSTWNLDPHVNAARAIVRRRAHGRVVRPDANLELDLGLDSMERVELVTELEQSFAVTIPAEQAHEILTVSQLIEACRPAVARTPHSRELPRGMPMLEDPWAFLLRDVPAELHSALRGLLARRPIAVPLLFVVSRLGRLLLGPGAVTGLEHLPRKGPYIISPNHQGYLDPIIVSGVLPYRLFPNLFVVGAAEYFETPLMRRLARAINLVPADPDANLVMAMKASAFGLQHGKILMLFPEGERSIDGTVKRFKKGAPILAQHLGVPIVPVAIRGAFELWPRNRAIDWTLLRPWSRHVVRVAFGPPMRFERTAEYAESANRLRDVVVRLWNELR